MLNKYSIMIEGINIYKNNSGHLERMGFYTTRWVESSNRYAAKIIALDLVKQELESLGLLSNPSDSPPVYIVDEIHKVDSFDGFVVPGKGFSLFLDP